MPQRGLFRCVSSFRSRCAVIRSIRRRTRRKVSFDQGLPVAVRLPAWFSSAATAERERPRDANTIGAISASRISALHWVAAAPFFWASARLRVLPKTLPCCLARCILARVLSDNIFDSSSMRAASACVAARSALRSDDRVDDLDPGAPDDQLYVAGVTRQAIPACHNQRASVAARRPYGFLQLGSLSGARTDR